MAKVKIEMPSGFMDQIADMGNALDTAIPKALAAGGKVVMDKMKSNLQAAIGRGTKTKSRSTGKGIGIALGAAMAAIGTAAVAAGKALVDMTINTAA